MRFNYSKILTKTYLLKEYIANHKTSYDIANELHCCQYTVWKYLKSYNLGRNNSEKQIGIYNHHFKNYPKRYCIDCGKLLSLRAYYWKFKRCTSCCRKGKLCANYIDGRSFESYPQEFNRCLKKAIKDRDDHICQKCDMTEEEHQILYRKVLTIHHIDYNKKNNNKINLITLCTKCNTKANYNRVASQKVYEDKIGEIYALH